MLGTNFCLNTDSYKFSHHFQYPQGTEVVYSYIESRGGEWDETVFFGLQAYLKEYLSVTITKDMVDKAEEFCTGHGVPFYRDGWDEIVNVHGGKLPVVIRAVPEGTVLGVRNVMATIENTGGAKTAFLPSHIETSFLRAVWYGTTVATQSFQIKKLILAYLEETGDPSTIGFKLHDFGARGVSSFESAALGGMAHLVNFMGTDTVSGVLAARAYYGEQMAGFSIPAAEHSTITSWGKENEVEAYRNMLTTFAKPNAIVAIVSDSYDIYNACSNLWGGELRQQIIDSGAVVVIRPDSGHPATVVEKCIRLLDEKFGSVVNAKGYRVLNNVRIIQGDGVNPASIFEILFALKNSGYSADNVAFGMGGKLLQGINRDTCAFAMKCSAIKINGVWNDVYKEPVGDAGKKSKRGRVDLFKEAGNGFYSGVEGNGVSQLVEVFRDGEIVKDYTFAEVRTNAAAGLVK